MQRSKMDSPYVRKAEPTPPQNANKKTRTTTTSQLDSDSEDSDTPDELPYCHIQYRKSKTTSHKSSTLRSWSDGQGQPKTESLSKAETHRGKTTQEPDNNQQRKEWVHRSTLHKSEQLPSITKTKQIFSRSLPSSSSTETQMQQFSRKTKRTTHYIVSYNSENGPRSPTRSQKLA